MKYIAIMFNSVGQHCIAIQDQDGTAHQLAGPDPSDQSRWLTSVRWPINDELQKRMQNSEVVWE